MTRMNTTRRMPSQIDGTRASTSNPTRLAWLYAVRGVLAIVWAGAFAAVCDSLTVSAAVLLLLYPVIDVIASVVDSIDEHSPSKRRVLWVGASTSAAAAVALAVAGAGEISDVLHVFGVWATVSGVTQIVVAVRRRGPATGGQWPMLLAGALSALVGIVYNVQATAADPELNALVTYAAAGGAFFVIQAGILAWRHRHAPVPEVTR